MGGNCPDLWEIHGLASTINSDEHAIMQLAKHIPNHHDPSRAAAELVFAAIRFAQTTGTPVDGVINSDTRQILSVASVDVQHLADMVVDSIKEENSTYWCLRVELAQSHRISNVFVRNPRDIGILQEAMKKRAIGTFEAREHLARTVSFFQTTLTRSDIQMLEQFANDPRDAMPTVFVGYLTDRAAEVIPKCTTANMLLSIRAFDDLRCMHRSYQV